MTPDYVIFSDASVILSGACNYSAYAAVILNCETKAYTTISGPLSNRSIAFCEGYAIYQGLRYLKQLTKSKHKKDKVKILVVTDSKNTVTTFTQWIQNSWDTTDWYHWKTSQKEPVKNQDLYRSIIKVLNSDRFKVKFIHINSHSNGKKGAESKIFAKLVDAKVHLSEKTAKIFIEMNDLADKVAHRITREMYNERDQFDDLLLKRKG